MGWERVDGSGRREERQGRSRNRGQWFNGGREVPCCTLVLAWQTGPGEGLGRASVSVAGAVLVRHRLPLSLPACTEAALCRGQGLDGGTHRYFRLRRRTQCGTHLRGQCALCVADQCLRGIDWSVSCMHVFRTECCHEGSLDPRSKQRRPLNAMGGD